MDSSPRLLNTHHRQIAAIMKLVQTRLQTLWPMHNKWAPIAPLSEQDVRIDLSDLESLRLAWLEMSEKLRESSPANLKEFNEKLARQWCIETGILERAYDLDRETTLVLIEHGFLAELIDRRSTNKDPVELVEILRDHKAAIDLVHDCVGNSRELTTGLIHEFHAILTRHQETVEAVDQFGNPVSFTLKHGAFKNLPNNPRRQNSSFHEYSPPLNVPQEMGNLLKWFSEYKAQNPVLQAAWMHHRFTQIHPYQDGNGRVARLLTNLVLVKDQLFPVVVTRDQRSEYIQSLELADQGNLAPLARFFAEIEKKTILQALSVAPDSGPSTTVLEKVTGAIADKLRKRHEETMQQLRLVNNVAEGLRSVARHFLNDSTPYVINQIDIHAEMNFAGKLILGGPDKNNQHWYHFQVVKTAQESGQSVNFSEDHFFVRSRISAVNIPSLTFVVSFHHIGQELSGVMEATCFA